MRTRAGDSDCCRSAWSVGAVPEATEVFEDAHICCTISTDEFGTATTQVQTKNNVNIMQKLPSRQYFRHLALIYTICFRRTLCQESRFCLFRSFPNSTVIVVRCKKRRWYLKNAPALHAVSTNANACSRLKSPRRIAFEAAACCLTCLRDAGASVRFTLKPI